MCSNMEYPERYLNKLWDVINQVEIRDSDGKVMTLDSAIRIIISKLRKLKKMGNKVIFIGNGGSAGIASHQSIDYWKNGGIPATCFNATPSSIWIPTDSSVCIQMP